MNDTPKLGELCGDDARRDWHAVVTMKDEQDEYDGSTLAFGMMSFFTNYYSDEAEAALDDPETCRLFWSNWSVVTGLVLHEPWHGGGEVFGCGCR